MARYCCDLLALHPYDLDPRKIRREVFTTCPIFHLTGHSGSRQI